jgi:serine/threonine-protein kinase RsbW
MVDDPSDPRESSAEELYEHAPCGYLSTDPDGTIIRINGTLLGWLGYQRADLVGRRTFQSLLSVGGRVYYETHYDPLLRMQGTVREIAVDLVRRDGSTLPALVNSDVWPGGPGSPGVVRTTVFGAAFRRRYETELLAARRAAERAGRQLALIQELVSDFAVAVTRADVASVLAGKGLRVARAESCAVWLRSDDGAALDWIDGTPPPDAGVLRTPLAGPAPHARAANRAEPVLEDPADGSPAVLFVQLTAAETVLGVAGFGYPSADRVDADLRQLLRTVGRQAGQTLQRTALFEAEKGLRLRAETLQSFTSALAAPLDARQIADTAAGCVSAALDLDRVLVVLAGDPDPVVGAAAGFPPQIVDGWRRDPARLAPALAWPDADGTFESARGLPEFSGPGVPAVLPLRVGPTVLGALVLGRGAGTGFTTGERAFLRTFSAHCAQALERARLSAEAAEQQREAEFLVRLSRRLDETPGLRRRAAELADGLVPEVAERARVEFHRDGKPEWLAVAPPSAEARDRFAGEVALPLRARGRVIGTLVLDFAATSRVAGRSRFLSELAEAAGLALDNGRLYDQEHRNAHILQRALLAGEPPADRRAAIATWYRPAISDLEVGGDWHDSFLVGPDRLAIVVGDVVGRGIRAAATMGHLRSAVRAIAATDPGPAGLLERLDRFVDRFEDGRMTTVAYGVLDLSTGSLRYACAGHLPPLLIEPDGRGHLLWDGRSAPIAAYAGLTGRTEGSVTLAPGARLLVYTDGLVERRASNLHTDLDRLVAEAASRFRTPLGQLLPDLAGALADEPGRDDDVCMLCVAYGFEEEFVRTVLADVRRLKSLRDDLRTWLGGTKLAGPDRDAVVLACSEAAANAMEHAYGNDGRGLVEVWAAESSGTVELTVRDRGGWREPGPHGDRGRGLALIASLMDEISIDRDGGTVVTMRRRSTVDGSA